MWKQIALKDWSAEEDVWSIKDFKGFHEYQGILGAMCMNHPQRSQRGLEACTYGSSLKSV